MKEIVHVRFEEENHPDLARYQNVNQFLKHLPYFDKIKANAYEEFSRIKTNLTKSLVLNEIRPGFVHWTNRLQTFVNEYGLFFTKSDHIKLVKIYLQLINTPDIDLIIVDLCFSILVELLKKYELLSRDDLQIDWKPLYNLYIRIHKVDEYSSTMAPENLEQISFLNFISFARIYFQKESTMEILDELKPLMCPFDMSMSYAFERYNLFLPTIFAENEEIGFNLWFSEFLDLWFTFSGKVLWESNIINLFSRLAKENIGLIDWTPYIPCIFSKILRGLGLSISNEFALNNDDESTPKETVTLINTLSESFSYTDIDMDAIATWIVSMINCSSERGLCMKYLRMLFQILRSYYYPSNTGPMEKYFSLLQQLPESLIQRIRNERSNKYEWLNRNNKTFDSQITDQDILEFVLILKDIVLIAIFSKTNFNDAIKTFQYLCFLRPDLMLPSLIDKLYTSLHTLVEPHRYPPLLACLVSVPREIVCMKETRLHVIPLLIAVLPGININDLNKFILTFQFMTNLISNVLLIDCEPALIIRNDLNQDERFLCLQTNKFEDFINQLFDKLFNFIDYLAQDSSDNPSYAYNIYSRANQNLNDENVTQVHVIQMLKVLVNQSSKAILKQILNKLYGFINGNTYNLRSGEIIASLVGFLVTSGYGKPSFEKYFEYVYGNLIRFKDGKNFNTFIQSEKGDSYIMWNLHLLSKLLKADGLVLIEEITRIKELLYWYRSSVNKECISHLTACYNNIIISLTKIYPRETCSVGYSIIFDDELQFFTEHLPIRDWGYHTRVKDLKIDYHIPSHDELTLALDIVGEAINESITFLRQSIMSIHAKNNKHIMKEENYRELNYMYHIMYGASCLLKRPSNRQIIQEHIDSSVDIGLQEEIDKGLGFETINVKDQNHEYYYLKKDNINILLNMRENLIEFVIKLADKLIEDNSNDTILLILISRILTTASSIYGMFPLEFEKNWKGHFVNKSTLQNKLVYKKYPREELIRRVMLQYNYRCFHLHISLTELDFKIINILTNLSVNSFYEIVREESRTQLFELLAQFPYSALTILPNLIKFLNKSNSDKKFTKEQLEGCLLLLKGNTMQTSLLIKQNWFILNKLWPALYKCKHFEKESIKKILDSIYFNTNINFDSFNNQAKFDDKLIELAFDFNPALHDIYSLTNETSRLKVYHQKCFHENQLISRLMEELVSIASDSNATWKNQEISLFSLIFLLNSCENNPKLLTADCVSLFTDALVHENINYRRIGIDALCITLKIVKFKKQVYEIDSTDLIRKETYNQVDSLDMNEKRRFKPGPRNDNYWHMYNPNYVNVDPERFADISDNDIIKWENTIFLDKSYSGYYCWPSRITVNSNHRQFYNIETLQSKLDFAEAIKPIRDRFKNDKEFIEKFIKLSQIEESKENEKFDKKKFYLFKSLFRNFGSSDIFYNLFNHLAFLIQDQNPQTIECSHKLAAEIICGLIRGSKYWSLKNLRVLWASLKYVFDLIIENLANETISLWIDCFSISFEDQDPRRMTFYISYFEKLFLETLHELYRLKLDMKAKPSLRHINTIQLLSVFNQFEWRIPQFWSNLINPMVKLMNHSYKPIRESIPSVLLLSVTNECDHLVKIPMDNFSNDLNLDSIFKHKMNNLSKFIDLCEAKLMESIELFDLIESSEDKNAVKRNKIEEIIGSANFLQTFLNWLILYISRSTQPLNLEILRLITFLIKIDKIANGEEGLKIKLSTIRMFLPICSLDKNCFVLIVEEIKRIISMKNWHSKLAGLQMLKTFAIFNMFILNDELKLLFEKIVLTLLEDEQLEVRVIACLTLTDFIHSNFMYVDQALIQYFKNLTKNEIKTKDIDKIVINKQNLVKRHSGVLGLCSIVNSSPYDLPAYLPDIVSYLCEFINDPQPIQDTVKKCLSDFKRTHHDNWNEHKLNFDEQQLSILSDTFTSPNYFS